MQYPGEQVEQAHLSANNNLSSCVWVFSFHKWRFLSADELTVVYLNNLLGDPVIELITFIMQRIKLIWISSPIFREHLVCEEVTQ